MKITFLLPALNLTGGVKVVSIYAQLLTEKGHKVTVVVPSEKEPSFNDKLKSAVKWKDYAFKRNFNTTFFDKRDYELKILKEHRAIKNDDIPNADIVIATFWNTAEWMAEYSKEKGKKVYFIQHYEVHPWLPVDRVEKTFLLPFRKIVVAQWIADTLCKKYDLDDVPVVGNGVDQEQFFSKPRLKNKVFTVGVMYADELSFKGCDTSIASVLKARECISNIKLVAFAKHPPLASLPLPEDSEFFLKPEQENIRDIYGQCDVWLFGSRSEGFGLPILEAMACGTPVIGTRAGAAPELLNLGAGFLVDIDDVDAMAAAIVSMAEMTSDEWKKLSDDALIVAQDNSWAVKVDELEKVLLGFYNGT